MERDDGVIHMNVKTFPSTCAKTADHKHIWENVPDYSKPPVQVSPLVWGNYRKIICTQCGKERDMKEENGELIWEE